MLFFEKYRRCPGHNFSPLSITFDRSILKLLSICESLVSVSNIRGRQRLRRSLDLCGRPFEPTILLLNELVIENKPVSPSIPTASEHIGLLFTSRLTTSQLIHDLSSCVCHKMLSTCNLFIPTSNF